MSKGTSRSMWERQSKETERAYNYFCCYRDLGNERSLLKVSQHFTKSVKYFKDLSSQYNWVERANAYDDYIEKKIREANEKEIQKEALESLKMIRNYKNMYKIPLSMIADLSKDKKELEALKSLGLHRIFNLASKSVKPLMEIIEKERLLTGESTENTESQQTIKVVIAGVNDNPSQQE